MSGPESEHAVTAAPVTGCYPVLCTTDIERSRDFWTVWFGYEVVFSADWDVSLRRADQPGYELGLVRYDHPTVPADHRRPVTGLLLTFEVPDVDAEYQRLVRDGGLVPEVDLRDEEFGQRHFILAAPDGVLVDVVTPIAPTAEFAAGYLG